MSLASISFDSVQNALYSSYKASSPQPAAPVATNRLATNRLATNKVVSIASVSPATSSSQTVLATDLSALLTKLAAGDVAGSKAALTSFQADLQQGGGGEAGGGLSQLLTTLSGTLQSGNTTQALGHVQSFLLNAGKTTGTAISIRV